MPRGFVNTKKKKTSLCASLFARAHEPPRDQHMYNIISFFLFFLFYFLIIILLAAYIPPSFYLSFSFSFSFSHTHSLSLYLYNILSNFSILSLFHTFFLPLSFNVTFFVPFSSSFWCSTTSSHVFPISCLFSTICNSVRPPSSLSTSFSFTQ